MAATEIIQACNPFGDIIKLQLRKPRNWNWQLSTSKSSSHISLPKIELYDYKGHLILETKEDRKNQRQSWHSSQSNEIAKSKIVCAKTNVPHLQRCRSDILEHNSSANKRESIIKREKSYPDNRTVAKSSSEVLGASTCSDGRRGADATNENKTSRDRSENAIRTSATSQKSPHQLRKSRSDLLDFEGMQLSNIQEDNRILDETLHVVGNKVETKASHRRTRSDDVYKRKLKFNNEHVTKIGKNEQNSIHLNITKENVSNRKLPKPEESTDLPQYGNNTEEFSETGSELLRHNMSDIAVNCSKHKRYKTRTCSAGTLIISEESFNKTSSRRRFRQSPRNDKENSSIEMNNKGKLTPDKRNNTSGKSVRGTISSNDISHIRQSSDPTFIRVAKHRNSKRRSNHWNPTERGQDCQRKVGERFDHRDNFSKTLLGRLLSENLLSNEKCDSLARYRQRDIKLARAGEIERTCDPIKGKLQKKKRSKVQRRYSDGSTSSGTETEVRRNIKGYGTKVCLSKEQPRSIGGGLFDKSDLLRVVRRLPSSDHVIMGANVSRHSSKGLSGRRSQSSGSICNGKGRHNDSKVCGSLPSYLDDRNSNGCNNNHDCEKQPLPEVARIPPLGDGAPLHWKFSDTQTALCDQGYGSERSPEEEYPPPLPEHDSQCHHHLEPHACYPFITPESTFAVKLTKGSRGLGLSVTGGIDSGGSWPGLIRIKRLFPHQPASQCGLMNVGDLLLEANGITLTGLTNYEALEVLRTAANQVELKVCRPPPDVLSCVSPISEVPPPPPRREPPIGLNLPPTAYSSPDDDYYRGDFDVTLSKIQGSLGFTLRKEDDSALGHYVRALVREPALTDGRIKAGDKIIAVNEVEISPMSHEQAVQFLRQCGDVVKLRLYRDSAQTPVAALSPTETTPRASFSRKANLRQEAVDMLNDIAVRKLIPGNQDTYRRSLSPSASPRRLRRQPYPSDASQETIFSTKYLINDEQFHEGLLHCSIPFEDDPYNSLFIIESDDCDKPSRPSSLDLYNPNQTPVAARKPRFNFSLAHNAYELNNLDAEVLDAPNLTYNLGNDDAKNAEIERCNNYSQEPASMPHIPLDNPGFSYKNPAYQTAHPQCAVETEERITLKQTSKVDDSSNMKKWKGVVFESQEEQKSTSARIMMMREENEILAIELNRGWNSRLGFSLQGAAGVTYVSAVHADSVAAKDGRLKPGDRLIKVNDESVEHMSTTEIIDLLRIVRGPVCIVVSRANSKEDCIQSNAAN